MNNEMTENEMKIISEMRNNPLIKNFSKTLSQHVSHLINTYGKIS